MGNTLPKPPTVPCGSCPYLKSTPSGVWEASEYKKLSRYDGSIMQQMMSGAGGLFMCHKDDGCLCGGWVVTHGVDNLAALRMTPVDPSTYDYDPDVEVWSSGREAAIYGMRDIDDPSDEALKVMGTITRRRGKDVTE